MQPAVGISHLAVLSGILLLAGTTAMRAAGVSLSATGPDTNGWIHLVSPGAAERVHELQSSPDLGAWTSFATLHDGPFNFADTRGAGEARRFFRALTRSKRTDDDGKNQVAFPGEAFLSPFNFGTDDPRWVKFAILLSDPTRVYFQDSTKFSLHYDYATLRLKPFAGLTHAQFDALSLRTNGQQVVLGAVLFPSEPLGEFGIQFAGLDPFPAADVVKWFRLVDAAVFRSQPARALYLPAFEQQFAAQSQRAIYEANGIALADAGRWARDDSCYAGGWAVGRLVFVPGSQIAAAYASGTLRPADILLTDGVPAEVPYVAGIISLQPATPNSHVAILARSYGIPFVYVAAAAQQAALRELDGSEVMLRTDPGWTCGVKSIGLDPDFDPALRAEILALKPVPAINLTPIVHLGSISAKTDGLTSADRRYFGGKAANFGLLRRHTPTNSPAPAIAFSFDLWDEFLDQPRAGGQTLRQEIRARTAGFTYPPDMAAVAQAMEEIRDIVRRDAIFTSAQRTEILAALQDFTPTRKIRFRSSSNVEDDEQFTGAGLFDSYSGCLADDLDGDSTGPSACDPDEPEERGVFRAIRRVYASFYNDNAWLERLRRHVDEDTVGMAVLAHYSFPDEDELANGVATLDYRRDGNSRQYLATLVTQAGAVSVSNPEGNARAEVIEAWKYSFDSSVWLNTVTRSDLVPLGAYVLDWPREYTNLVSLLMRVTDGALSEAPADLLRLNFEYKKSRPDDLVLKQVRSLPPEQPGRTLTSFLLNEGTTWCVAQGEIGEVSANHRLKCLLSLQSRNTSLATSNLTTSLFTRFTNRFAIDTNIVELAGNLAATADGFGFSRTGNLTLNRWTNGTGAGRREFTLEAELRLEVTEPTSPLFTPVDFPTRLRVRYATPQPILQFDGVTKTVIEEEAFLVPCRQLTAGSLAQQRSFQNKNGLKIETRFYWPEPPRGAVAGYTAPVQAWIETVITGLTSSPLVLRGDFSQTYHPFHHNFAEEFIFDPWLAPEVDENLRAELMAKNIRWLLAAIGTLPDTSIFALGFDGKYRRLP